MKYERRCSNCLEINIADEKQANKKINCYNCNETMVIGTKYILGKKCSCCWCNTIV